MTRIPSSQRVGIDYLFFLPLALFLNAGSFKADPRLAWLPVDLTLLSAAMLLAIVTVSLLRDVHRVAGRQFLLTLAFLGLVLPGVLLSPSTEYATEKSLYLVTLTLLAFMGGMEVGQVPKGLERMVGWLCIFSLIITSDAVVKVLTQGDSLHRVSGFGGTTIALGRAAGLVFLVEGVRFLLWPARLPRQLLSLAICLTAGATVLFSGSRGPLLSALVALTVVILSFGRKGALPRFVTIMGLIVLALGSIWSLMPAGSMGRMAAFFAGDFGDSETSRWEALQRVLPIIVSHPCGVGWGGFAQISNWGSVGRQYVHNLAAELFLEGGWIAGTGFILLFVHSWKRVREFAHSKERALLGGLLLFELINALVSGDINDNRMFFMLLGYGLGYRSPLSRAPSSVNFTKSMTTSHIGSSSCGSPI